MRAAHDFNGSSLFDTGEEVVFKQEVATCASEKLFDEDEFKPIPPARGMM